MKVIHLGQVAILIILPWINCAFGQPINHQADSIIQLSALLKFTNPDSALYLAKLGLQKSERDNYKIGMARAYNILGTLKTGTSEYDTALYFHELALDLSIQSGNAAEEAESLNNLGIVKDELGDHQEAISNYLEALSIYEKLKDLDGQARMNNNLGIVYKDMKQFDKVVQYYEAAMYLYDSLQNKFGVAALSNNLATLYIQLGDYQKAVKYAEQGKIGFVEAETPQYIPYSQINLGDAYRELKKYDLAHANLSEAISTLEGLGNIKEQADALRSLSHLYQTRGQSKIAIEKAIESLRLARQVDAKVYIKNALQRLSESYESAGNLNAAITYYKRYEIAKDSLFNEERALQISRMQTLFETEKKENIIANQQLAIEQSEQALAARRTQIIVIVFISLIVLLGGLLFYQIHQAKQKRHMHEAILTEKQKGIEAIIHAQDEERKRIAKDLHDGIGQQLGGLKIKLQNLESLADGFPGKLEIHQIKNIVDETAQDLRTISHEMMPRALAEVGLAPAMNDILEHSLGAKKIDYRFENLVEEERYPERVEISIYRIFQELINNIIKHAEATQVSIQLLMLARKLILIIEDNGKGLGKEMINGHGLLNMKQRAEMLGGSVVIEAGKNRGLVTTVTVPII